jgi:hypothetical protein
MRINAQSCQLVDNSFNYERGHREEYGTLHNSSSLPWTG